MPEHMTTLRTRVSDAVYDTMTGEAALAGVSLAELARQVLTERFGGASPSPGSMTADERAQFKRWSDAATDDKNKKAWRVSVDAVLRGRSVDLPPLPSDAGDHDGLIAWACAAHPHTRAAERGIAPPRFKA